MEELTQIGRGGGVFSDEVTANKTHVLSGKTYLGIDTDDEIGTGTMPNRGVVTPSLGVNGTYEIKEGYYAPGSKVTQSIANNGAINGTLNCGQSKSIPAGYTTGGTVSANSLSSQTSGTAAASSILSGKTAWVNGSKITGTIASQGAQTITPGTADKTIATGKYLSGVQTIKGDANLKAANIIKGASIFGVAGNRYYIDKIGTSYSYNGYAMPSKYNTEQVISINTPETASYSYILVYWGCAGGGYFPLGGAGSTSDRMYLQFNSSLYYKIYMKRPTLTSVQVIFEKVYGSSYGICNVATVRICAGSNVAFS